MECKKSDYEQVSEQKTLKRSSYNNRKECIKKKTMQLATLCGINACTIIIGADGEIESWPENPTEAKATIKKFKDLTSNPNKSVTVRDESQKRVVDVPAGGKVVSCQGDLTEVKDDIKNFLYMTDIPCQRTGIRDETTKKVFAEPDGEVHSWVKNPGGSCNGKTFQEKAEIVDLAKMVEKSSLYSRRSSMTEYQGFFKQLDSRLEALTKRIEFLRRKQDLKMNYCCVENKQLDYSEKNKRLSYSEKTSPSPKRRRFSQEPVFLFDLNYPPPDEAESSCLSSEDYKDLRLGIV
ncbi:uncharacterized protein LOC141667782 [Apium graveolens]|uniref:uncharacterized protein LOC141667782 n=1 Tax=Apium graveolens TaxID=4045 RepID=UPI003D790EDC